MRTIRSWNLDSKSRQEEELLEFTEAMIICNEIDRYKASNTNDVNIKREIYKKVKDRISLPQYRFALFIDIDSFIIDEVCNDINAMGDGTETKRTWKLNPQKVKTLIRIAAYDRVGVNKVCVGNFLLPEFYYAKHHQIKYRNLRKWYFEGIGRAGITDTNLKESRYPYAVGKVVDSLKDTIEDTDKKFIHVSNIILNEFKKAKTSPVAATTEDESNESRCSNV